MPHIANAINRILPRRNDLLSDQNVTTRKIIQNATVVDTHAKINDASSTAKFPSNSHGRSWAIIPIVCVPTTPNPAKMPPQTMLRMLDVKAVSLMIRAADSLFVNVLMCKA